MISRIEYVHNKSFIHRDIKVLSILIKLLKNFLILAGQLPNGHWAAL